MPDIGGRARCGARAGSASDIKADINGMVRASIEETLRAQIEEPARRGGRADRAAGSARPACPPVPGRRVRRDGARQELRARGHRGAAGTRVWETSGYFQAGLDEANPRRYCILLPPPNVTGTLHMGHAFQHTLMDALTRYHRMRGYNTLWQPGTDHAGIATQIVVERQLEAEGTSRRDLGREQFVERVWEWKEESGSTITRQMRRLGASCDWSRERFTMDEGLSRRGDRGVRAPARGGPHLSRQAARQLGPGAADRGVRPRGRVRGGERARCGTSATRSPPAPASWSSRPRARKRCSATSPSRCTRTTSATRPIVGQQRRCCR